MFYLILTMYYVRGKSILGGTTAINNDEVAGQNGSQSEVTVLQFESLELNSAFNVEEEVSHDFDSENSTAEYEVLHSVFSADCPTGLKRAFDNSCQRSIE